MGSAPIYTCHRKCQDHVVPPQYPGVVIEVSYSQKRKDLPLVAKDYIIGSKGSIGVVVGITSSIQAKGLLCRYGGLNFDVIKQVK